MLRTVVLLFVLGTSARPQDLLPVANDSPLEPDWSAQVDEGIYSIAWSADTRHLAVGGRGAIRIYNIPDFSIEQTIQTGQQEVWALAWSPNGLVLVSGGKDGTIQFWSKGTLLKKVVQDGWVLDLQWKSDGHQLLATDFSGLAKAWDENGILHASIQLDGDGLGLSWSPDGHSFAVGTGQSGSWLMVFNDATRELIAKIRDVVPDYEPPFGYGRDEINGVQYSPDGKWLATAHQDGRILVRSAEGVRALAFAVQLHSPGTGGSRRVSWAPNGRLLASCGEDGRVNYVEFPGGKRRFELIQSEKPVWAVGWSPDGKWLAAGGEEGRLWIWLAESLPCSTVKRPVHIIERHYQRSGPSPTASPIQQHFFSWPFDWLHR
ncbi:MAG: hypothetical protein JO076_06205 [Verrucomicrobia bacterium]|nr:hypothetical protein [Verrucomicrobiota bacterium]